MPSMKSYLLGLNHVIHNTYGSRSHFVRKATYLTSHFARNQSESWNACIL